MKEYVILCYQITQGSADNISEVAVFDSLDKAKAYWKVNAATLQDSGHAWSGLSIILPYCKMGNIWMLKQKALCRPQQPLVANLRYEK